VIFFDFDSFRPVQGGDRATRAQRAKDAQRVFDEGASMAQIRANLPPNTFDFTALGANMGYMATPGANLGRASYQSFSRLSDDQLAAAVSTVAATPQAQ
jgi:hypothetical protein